MMRRVICGRALTTATVQHRFIESSLESVGTEVATKIAGVFGYGAEANIAKVVGEGMIGDYLHTF